MSVSSLPFTATSDLTPSLDRPRPLSGTRQEREADSFAGALRDADRAQRSPRAANEDAPAPRGAERGTSRERSAAREVARDDDVEHRPRSRSERASLADRARAAAAAAAPGETQDEREPKPTVDEAALGALYGGAPTTGTPIVVPDASGGDLSDDACGEDGACALPPAAIGAADAADAAPDVSSQPTPEGAAGGAPYLTAPPSARPNTSTDAPSAPSAQDSGPAAPRVPEVAETPAGSDRPTPVADAASQKPLVTPGPGGSPHEAAAVAPQPPTVNSAAGDLAADENAPGEPIAVSRRPARSERTEYAPMPAAEEGGTPAAASNAPTSVGAEPLSGARDSAATEDANSLLGDAARPVAPTASSAAATAAPAPQEFVAAPPIGEAPTEAPVAGISAANEFATDGATPHEFATDERRESPAPKAPANAGGASEAAVGLGGVRDGAAASETEAGAFDAEARAAAPDFTRALDELRGELRAGKREIVLRLDPPELGRLDVRLVQRGDAVVARVTAENPEVAEAFRRDRAQLERLFVDQGVPLLGLDVRSGAFASRGRQDSFVGHDAAASTASPSRPASPVRAAVRPVRVAVGALDLYA